MVERFLLGQIASWVSNLSGSICICDRSSIGSTRKVKKYISDISSWSADSGEWIGWNLQNLPNNLQDAAHQLQILLRGCAPICNTLKDKRGWGNGIYSVKQGYSQLLSQVNLPPKDKLWNSLWSNDSPPKVNSFCWIMAHGKLLTGKIFLKGTSTGPSDVSFVAMRWKPLSTSSFFSLLLPLCGKQLSKDSIRESDGRLNPENSSQIGLPSIGVPSRITLSLKPYTKPYPSTFAGKFGSPEIEPSSPIFALPLIL
jgi:hypothetical protein